MDVAVTGASGLIGSALAGALEADGHRVLRVVRPSSTARIGDTVAWSPADGTIDAAGLEGIDAVVHLAGEGIAERRWSDEQKRRILESRTTGTSLLATTLAGLQRPPKVFLSSSAIGFYGDRGAEVLTEQSEPGVGFLTDVCVAWEGATRPAEDAGIRVAHLRTGIVLDRKGGAMAKLVPLFRLGLGGRLGNGRQIWSWISLHDHLAAMRFLLDAPVNGPVNLTAPEPVSNARFTTALAKAVRRPALFPVPSFGPGVILGRELAQNLLFTSADVRPAVLRDAGFAFAHADIETALAAVLGKESA
jgi:uncharacterized protein (TIGR01777 family)